MESNLLYVNIRLSSSDIENKESHCNDCIKTQKFPSEQALKKHILVSHHSVDLHYPKHTIVFCYYCPVLNCRKHELTGEKYFTSRKHLTQHYLKVHNLAKFSCKLCSKKFSTESLRNRHMDNCGKVFSCLVCNTEYNSYEALLTHAKRKNHQHANLTKPGTTKTKKINKGISVGLKKPAGARSTKSVSTTTTTETSKLATSSVFTSTGDLLDLFPDIIVSNQPAVPSTSETKATATDDIVASMLNDDVIVSKPIKNSSTSTIDFFGDNEDSSSSSNKKNVNLNSANIDFSEDSLNIFDSNKFYSTETQTDFESLFNNNFTQTTFEDFDVFEKFDNQTQTNWIDLMSVATSTTDMDEPLFTSRSTETQTMSLDDDLSFI